MFMVMTMVRMGVCCASMTGRMKVIAPGQEVQAGPHERNGRENREDDWGGGLPKE
jgi:hypothetical protein